MPATLSTDLYEIDRSGPACPHGRAKAKKLRNGLRNQAAPIAVGRFDRRENLAKLLLHNRWQDRLGVISRLAAGSVAPSIPIQAGGSRPVS